MVLSNLSMKLEGGPEGRVVVLALQIGQKSYFDYFMHTLSQKETVQLHFNQLASTKTGGIQSRPVVV